MSANPQWDISRALGVARLFHLVCGVRDACVTPFLTLYLRQLGLTAPWVGILMGSKLLVAACWGPFCAFLAKSCQKRRVFLVGSLLGSAVASLLMVLVPPLNRNVLYHACNGSSGMTTTVLPPGVTFTVTITSAQESASTQPAGPPSLPAKRRPEGLEASGFTDGPGESEQEPLKELHLVGSFEGAKATSQVLHPVTSRVKDNTWEGASEVVDTAVLPSDAVLGGPANASEAKREVGSLDLSSEGLQWTFLLSLVFLVFWELLTAPQEQVANDSLYEYLDFVDATDRYRSLGLWRLLGMSAGVCSIAALVGRLDCFLMTHGTWGVVCFYSYSLVSTVSLLVSLAFPIPTYQQQEPGYKTIKALSLLGGNPHLLLLAFTVFLVGTVTSTVQNFLFWHMEDHGSSKLVMGFSVALSLLGEILFHPFKAVLLRKLSRVGAVGLGMGCLAGQLLYYSFLWSWWSVLPVQILSAISNGVLWWAMEASMEDLATPVTERPLSTMFRGHFYRGGCSLGSFVGGIVVMRFSLAVLYRACCVVLSLWLAMFLFIQPRLPQERKINYSKLLAVEGSDTSDSEPGSERDWLVKAMREEP
ncbi:major facilitator superfamily domain-containing protein 6-like [Fukomys damarensis]|uniref:Major facilitator superfamily domain-containing protein 6-like n=1 Tax=Fukomys damarensis TaxID=885580 RepID=A0A091CN13_FUKDA|nr:major facilitator superfamily domain-containing protein 6-like [Fukomys damarensis]KFO18873.1 Major facilitator superfamily domain-containing protein 6-like [Fukomys damarensis]